MQEGKFIGIIGLGWLGHKFARAWQNSGSTIWGTKRDCSLWNNIDDVQNVKCTPWNAPENPSAEMKKLLQKTDVLVLNLSPRGFDIDSYTKAIEIILSNVKPDTYVYFMSSTGVYKNRSGIVNEESEVDKTSVVWAGEEKVKAMAGSHAVIMRLGGLIGDDRHPVKYLAKKETFDNPNMPVNLIHYKDVIQICEEIFRQGIWGETINVCGDNLPNRLAFYSKEAERLGLTLPPVAKQKEETGKKVNTEKMRRLLGYHNFDFWRQSESEQHN